MVNYIGAKETGRLQNVIVVTLVAILTVFTLLGTLEADPSNLPPGKGLSPLMSTTGLIFVSYLGFVQITSVAEEIKDPGKNLPRAVIGSVVIVTTIYALVLIVMSAAVPQGFIADVSARDDIAVVEIGERLQGALMAGALLFGGLLATASSANASILASSRINFAMGRDSIVTPALNEIHDRFGTPYRSIATTGGLILLFLVVGDLSLLASVGSALHLIIYGLLNIALIVMRMADPEEYQPSYTVPLFPIVPILGMITSFALLGFIIEDALAITLVLSLGAMAWYMVYARSRTTKQGILGEYILDRADEMPGAAVTAASSVQPDGGEYRVMVPLANPEHEKDLITLASALAKQRGGTVVATHIVTVPDQTSLEYARENTGRFEEDPHAITERAREDAQTFGVPVETHTILSHRSFEEVFDAARTHDADTVVLGWGPHLKDGRAEGRMEELTHDLPCDFLVMKDRGFDPSRILVPTAGGPDSDLSAEVAGLLRDEYGSEISLLHVAGDDQTTDEAREFLSEWAEGHGLGDADLLIEQGDVELAIESAARNATMLIVGATERGLISRLVRDSPVMGVVDDVDCTVLLAEQARKRSLFERLFGND